MTSPVPLRQVFLLVAISYLNFLSRIVLAPLLPVIRVEFGLGHGEAGSLFLFTSIGYCAGLFGSTFISSQLNHRRTILLSAFAVGGAIVATSRAGSVPWMDAGLLLVGAAGGLYLPSGIAMLAEMISKKHWGKAMAIHEVAPNLGLFTAPLFAEFLLRWVGWRDVLGLLGVSSIVMGVLFLLLARGGRQKGEPPHPKAMEKVLGKPSFWIMAAVFVLLLGAEMGVYTMLPLFLVDELRFGRELANTLIGLTRGFIVVIVFFSGVIADRIGHQKAMVLFLAITGALTLMLGVLHGPFATTALMFLQAAFLACVFPAALAVVSLIFPSDLQGLAVSLLVLIGFLLGGGAIPPGIGYLADASSFSFGFALMGILILTFQPVLLYLRPGSHLDE